MRLSPPLALLTAALLAAMLVACGGKDAGSGGDSQASGDPAALPAPQGGGSGGITGMPDAGQPGATGAPEQTPQLDENGNPLPPADPDAVAAGDPAAAVPSATDPASTDPVSANPAAPDPASADSAASAEPSAEDAVAVVRDYYAAINGRHYDRAYALWSDGGRASGQDAQQFANGFAQTAGVSAQLAPPGRVDAGAGQRHIEVPVSIVATQRDGSQRRYVGAYTLRRTVVDGASAEQRAWRIASADIRELKP